MPVDSFRPSLPRAGGLLSGAAILAASALLAGAAHASAPVLSLGVVPGGTGSDATAVSSNGAFAAGTSHSVANHRAFVWSGAHGPQSLGVLPGRTDTWCTALSGNGQAAVGVCTADDGARAFLWTHSAGMRDLGVLPGGTLGAEAHGISFTGGAVCGTSHSADGFHAFRWTSAGMQDLGTLDGDYSNAFAISADGSVVVGAAGLGEKGRNGKARDDDKGGGEHAFVWTAAGGMQDLGALEEEDSSGALAVSADGSVATGYSGPTAVVWDADGMHDLEVLPGGSVSINYAISGDGRVAGGLCNTASGATVASLWTAQLGLVDLNSYLPGRGVDTTGWVLTTTTGLSHDGTTIVGLGSFNGQDRGWIVTLPRGRR
jgi:probable HAF family extracellular repeat protein